MTAIPLTFVDEPTRLAANQEKPKVVGTTTLRELCAAAEISCRVTADRLPTIALCRGSESYRTLDDYFVGIGDRAPTLDRIGALRVLETLAYGFLDYGARECVCGRGLFVGRRPVGRPSQLGRSRTAAERMRAMRARRAAVV